MIKHIRPLDLLKRLLQSKGYGIQSPTDYTFLREVLTEKLPYYRYEELCRGLTRSEQKLGCLYLRLSNWQRPALIVDPAGDKDLFWKAGCPSANICRDIKDGCSMLRISSSEQADVLAERFIDYSRSGAMMIVEKINGSKPLSLLWQTVCDDKRCGTTFDCGPCGIAWFDTEREKHHYKIII